MSLKPPKYLFLKAKEAKVQILGFTTIELPNKALYRLTDGAVDDRAPPAETWSNSWRQVKIRRKVQQSILWLKFKPEWILTKKVNKENHAN